jgi:hypothetical protein
MHCSKLIKDGTQNGNFKPWVGNYVWLLVVFPVAVAILVGVLGHSANLRIKTFLLIECGMSVLSPLLNAVIKDGSHTHHHRRKQSSAGKIRRR